MRKSFKTTSYMTKFIIIAFAGLIEMAAIGASNAQTPDDGYRRPARAGYYPQRGRAVSTDSQACIKLCPNDMLPCDPIYFKTADLRCFGGRNGR